MGRSPPGTRTLCRRPSRPWRRRPVATHTARSCTSRLLLSKATLRLDIDVGASGRSRTSILLLSDRSPQPLGTWQRKDQRSCPTSSGMERGTAKRVREGTGSSDGRALTGPEPVFSIRGFRVSSEEIVSRRRGSRDQPAGRLPAADAPVLHRRLGQDDEDVLGWNAFGPQVPDDRLVEPTFRVRRSARERRDLDERVALAGPGGISKLSASCSTMRCVRSSSGMPKPSTRAACTASRRRCFSSADLPRISIRTSGISAGLPSHAHHRSASTV